MLSVLGKNKAGGCIYYSQIDKQKCSFFVLCLKQGSELRKNHRQGKERKKKTHHLFFLVAESHQNFSQQNTNCAFSIRYQTRDQGCMGRCFGT